VGEGLTKDAGWWRIAKLMVVELMVDGRNGKRRREPIKKAKCKIQNWECNGD
jgi:hypothetical protein